MLFRNGSRPTEPPPATAVPEEVKAFLDAMKTLVPDDFSPREALQRLYDLKAQAKSLPDL